MIENRSGVWSRRMINMGLQDLPCCRKRLEHIEAVSFVRYCQGNVAVGLQQPFAILQEAENIRDMFDDVRGHDVVVSAGLADRLEDRATARDVIDLLDAANVLPKRA